MENTALLLLTRVDGVEHLVATKHGATNNDIIVYNPIGGGGSATYTIDQALEKDIPMNVRGREALGGQSETC